MKKILVNKTYNLLIASVMLALVWSCKEKDAAETEVCSGTPSVTNVTIPTDRTKKITGAKLDEWIVLQGANLCDVNAISLNDVAVNMKEAYVTAKEITLRIPKTVPKAVSNKITLMTPAGEQKVDFTVYLAPLIAYGYGGATEEYTPAGQNLVILCKNLDLYNFKLENTKVMFGTVEAKATKVTAEEIHVTVPNGIAKNTKVTISNGAVEKDVQRKYKDTAGLIVNNDDLSGSWTGDKSSEGPNPAPIDGKYRVCKGLLKAWDWNESFHFAQNQPLSNAGITAGNVNRYLVKFEVNVPKDWSSNPLRIWYRPTKLGTMNYNFPWGGNNFSGATFKTSGWQTVTIPLKDFMFSEDDAGNNKGKNVTILNEEVKDWIEYRIYVFGGDQKEMEVYWDNFRIVPVPVLE
jgi:hypothetical protein